MDANTFLEIAREGMYVLIKISAPVMVVSLVIGLVISLFQALTQIQEMTLTFVPKILAIFFTLVLFLPFMLSTLTQFTESLAERIIHIE